MGLFDFLKGKKNEESADVASNAAGVPQGAENAGSAQAGGQNGAQTGGQAGGQNGVDENGCTVGWDAITAEFERIYPGQEDPKHYGTLISWRLGGKDPLDGISIYDDGDCWHFVTYGLSELYEKESEDEEYSGYGMEFTLRLKKTGADDEETEIKGICGILQTIARITFQQGEIFNPYEYLYTGQTAGMDVKQQSKITGFITVPDVKAHALDTPNGKVEFVEFIGATDRELLAVKNKQITVKELYEKLGSDITDYSWVEVVLDE